MAAARMDRANREETNARRLRAMLSTERSALKKRKGKGKKYPRAEERRATG